jgi:hypothetical protein
MDISSENRGASSNHRPDSFSAFLQKLLGIFRRWAVFFTLTESDRKQAGIFLRRRGS